MSFSASNPQQTLGTSLVSSQASSSASSSSLSVASPRVDSLVVLSQPTPVINLPESHSPLLVQDTNTNTVTVYSDSSLSQQSVLVSKTGTYFGDNVPAKVPLQPKQSDGTTKSVVAFDTSIVLTNADTTTGQRQPVTFDPSTGRLLVVQSSKRFKDDIQEASDLDIDSLFSTLHVKSYTDKATGQKEYGFIAEELQEFPQLQNFNEKGELVGIKYELISILAVSKLQKLQQQIDKIKAHLNL
jgi:hypothetical protein